MYRRIPIFRTYPVRLPIAMAQRAAGGELHPEDEDEAVASTPHIRNEVSLLIIKSRTTDQMASGLGSWNDDRGHWLFSRTIVKQLQLSSRAVRKGIAYL